MRIFVCINFNAKELEAGIHFSGGGQRKIQISNFLMFDRLHSSGIHTVHTEQMPLFWKDPEASTLLM